MRHKHTTFVPLDADLTFFASNVTGADWELTTFVTTDLLAHKVTIRNDSVTDHSGKTADIVGYDRNNRKITEILQLPAGSATVTSSNYFWKLVSVTPSATIGADTMDIGITNTCTTLPVPLNYRSTNVGVTCIISGTIDYTLQNSNSNIQNKDATIDWLPHDDAAFVNATVSGNTNFSFTPMAMSILFNSSTNPGSVTLNLAPSDSGR